MKKTMWACMLLASGMAISSCGTAKKLEAANAELAGMRTQAAAQAAEIAQWQTELAKAKEAQATLAQEVAEQKAAKEALIGNLRAINKALSENGKTLREIYTRLDSSLVGFSNAGLEVKYANGLVYVSAEDQLMFTGGGKNVGWEGRQALKVIADVINDYPDIEVYVVGHTDNQARKKLGFADNWTESTERANYVTRVLVSEMNVAPTRILSAGHGMYRPVASNDTPEGQANNCRTMVVLNPKLDRLWEMSGRQ